MSAAMPRRVTTIMLACLALSACRHRRPSSDDPLDAPRLDRIQPDSVVAPRGSVVEVLLVGKGFAPGRPGANTVEFAGMSITDVPATMSGDTIRFMIPESVTRGGEAPAIALETGAYTVRVRTTTGVSNARTIRVYR